MHLMVSTSRKLPAICASAILHAMHARLVLITLHSMSMQGGGRGDQCALKGPYPHKKGSVILWPHTAPILCRKLNCWQRSLTLPALSGKQKKTVVLLGSAEQVCALPGHEALSFCCRGAKKRNRCCHPR